MQKRYYNYSSTQQSVTVMGEDSDFYSPKLKSKRKTNYHWTLLDYVNLLNINTAKVVSIALVLWFALFHGVIHIFYGVTHCKGLLEDGMYKEGGGGLWQPWGCMMHRYSKSDAEKCFRYNAFYGKANTFAFIGDSRTQQLYFSMKHYLSGFPLDDNFQNVSLVPQTLSWTSGILSLKLQFYPAKELNNDIKFIIKQFKIISRNYPKVIIIGFEFKDFTESNDSAKTVLEIERNLISLRQSLEDIAQSKKIKILWILHPHVFEVNLKDSNLTNVTIDKFREMTTNIFKSVNPDEIIIWSSLARHVDDAIYMMDDGYHLPKVVLQQSIYMLLNLHCNDNMNFNDGSCCKSSDIPSGLQTVTFYAFLSCAFIFVARRSYIIFCLPKTSNSFEIYSKVQFEDDDDDESEKSLWKQINLSKGWTTTDDFLWVFTKLGFILAYFYVCDRTNFLMKENKYFTHLNFWIPVFYVAILGIFFHEETEHVEVMNRDQTEEWKGWMQLLILIYHMTGGKSSQPITMLIQVVLSGYLFLNGFCHLMGFWTYGPSTIICNQDNGSNRSDAANNRNTHGVRFLQVLFRMNFLTVMLCITMNRPYQFYQFVPLATFAFVMQYAVMICPPHVTASDVDINLWKYAYMLIKFIVFGFISTMLYMSQIFFEKVFVMRPWKALFVTQDDDISEWWSRWKIDRYTTLYGMLFALLIIILRKLKLIEDSNHLNLCPRSVSVFALSCSIIGIGSYAIFGSFCPNPKYCNEIHPYIVFIPLISYVLLRNVSGWLRSRYSTLFAWFGKISLELFICQYHIWLAADAYGVLVLIPNYPVINVLLTSFIFVTAAHEIHKITDTLLPQLVPNNASMAWRNCIVFLVIMIPVAINDGMF